MTAVRCSDAERRGRRVVAEARRWIGTPYAHQASLIGVGTDCLGLVRGIWRALLGPEPERPGGYTADWAEGSGEERLLAAAHRHLIPVGEPGAGDVLIFRMRAGAVAKHAGILSTPGLTPGRMIHAYTGHGVVESSLGTPWLYGLAGAFRFPEVG